MEWLKQMSLKKSFFCLTLLFLLIALLLSTASIIYLDKMLQPYGASLEFTLDHNTIATPPETDSIRTLPSWYHPLNVLQLVLPVLWAVAGLLAAAVLFYRIKLKNPLSELKRGAERIMRHDLDFSIRSFSDDELGRLCRAFETMRQELLKNNKELWRQMEERKRLNAAFSHDLRNPVTVLKGSAKMLKKETSNGASASQGAQDAIALIEEYAGRIEAYVKAMSSVQHLDQLSCSISQVNWESLTRELSDSIHLLAMDTDIDVQMRFEPFQEFVRVDKAVLFNVAENLVSNALRYAGSNITVLLSGNEDQLMMTVKDDGNGFPSTILRNGVKPFFRGEQTCEHNGHLGMGLYVCRMLCEKHGGSLKLENMPDGALATAVFHSSQP